MADNRPLSPHLDIYRWQITMTMSILHRATGVALVFGLAALSYWLSALAGGERSYEAAMALLESPLGWVVVFGWTFSFAYHLLNGVRHLSWDAGYGFERKQRHASGWLAVAGAVMVTAGVGWVVWHGVHA